MSSMGDLGRQFERIQDAPQPARAPTELDDLETRLKSFFEWARGRPDPDIKDRFRSEFGATDLSEEYVDAINAGRGDDHRDALARLAREKSV